MPSASLLQQGLQAARLGKTEALQAALLQDDDLVNQQDAVGKTCLHWAAGYGHSDCVDLLLGQKTAKTAVKDTNGDCALHCAALDNQPMSAYSIAKASPGDCLALNNKDQTPVDIAVEGERGEVLNAMLLACASDHNNGNTTPSVALRAMSKLLEAGGVADTWAPNGSSALMLAASADCTEAASLLLEKGATLELQDALGRSAMMFAAGNNAPKALSALIAAGGSVSQRDKRGRQVLDYAAQGTPCHEMLKARHKALQEEADRHQAALLAELDAKETASGQLKARKTRKRKHRKKKDASAADADDHSDGNQQEDECLSADKCPSPKLQQPAVIATAAEFNAAAQGEDAGDLDFGRAVEACKPAADEVDTETCSTSGRIKSYQDGKRGLGQPLRIIEIVADASIPTTEENSPESDCPECTLSCDLTSGRSDGYIRNMSVTSAADSDCFTSAESGSPTAWGQSAEGSPAAGHVEERHSNGTGSMQACSRGQDNKATQPYSYETISSKLEELKIVPLGASVKDEIQAVTKAYTERPQGSEAGTDWQVVKPQRKPAAKGKPPLAGPRPDRVQEPTPIIRSSTSSASLDSLADSMTSLDSRGFARTAQRPPAKSPQIGEQAAHETSERTSASKSALLQVAKSAPEVPAASTSAARVTEGNGTWAERVAGKRAAPSPSHSAPELASMGRPSSADATQAPFFSNAHMAWEADSRASSEGMQPSTPPSTEALNTQTSMPVMHFGAHNQEQAGEQYGYQLFSCGPQQLWTPLSQAAPAVSERELALQRELAGKDQEVQQLQLALEGARAEMARVAANNTRALQRAREQGYQAGQAQLLAHIQNRQYQPQPTIGGTMSNLLGVPTPSLLAQGSTFLPAREAAAQLGASVLQQAMQMPVRGGSPAFSQPGAVLRHHVGFRGPGGPTARAGALQRTQKDEPGTMMHLLDAANFVSPSGLPSSLLQQAGPGDLDLQPTHQRADSMTLPMGSSRQASIASASSIGLASMSTSLLGVASPGRASEQQSAATAASNVLAGFFNQHQRPDLTEGGVTAPAIASSSTGSRQPVASHATSIGQDLNLSLAAGTLCGRVEDSLPQSSRDLFAGLEEEFLRGADSGTAFCTPALLE